ncbi:YrrS family protein [Peribacillus cavernae]|nr:YrrS family protein [Peribacillus cavernae]MDQ0218211.1 type IV secretory pathway VirB10-like protein [Peribacillus cavernae]
MNKDQHPLHSASRSNRKDKQRKVNKVYNISIVVVSLLIVVVGITIFFGSSGDTATETASSENNSAKQTNRDNKETSSASEADKANPETDKEGQADSEKTSVEEDIQKQDAAEAEAEKENAEAEEDNAEAEEDNADSKVGEPIGTSQTGKHTTSFEKGSADWNEMTQAMASATGLDQANMTIWWLGNGGSPNTATGTVSAKNDPKKYRVNLEWVDGAGWKPVKVQ